MPPSFFAYVRVSTAKQGEEGVSLQEQRAAITQYAERHGLAIVSWFEERQTAAKRGRPMFTQMLRRLGRAEAKGVIIHKIDRSARNLKDWADLGDLIDAGVVVHFANESLDLHSRGGRLSADIQAVVAADYIRNLREETRKGFYGRLKQGLYPLPAPIGYVDRGTGNAKEADPTTAPLVRLAFELYASDAYSLETLREELQRRGLRNRRGRTLSITGLSTMLNNPFYLGVIRLKRTREVFRGSHEPLIRKPLFDRVQTILTGKTHRRVQQHAFSLRRLFTCSHCGRSLIGERQKGHVYYRCQIPRCPTNCVRQEALDAAVTMALEPLKMSPEEHQYLAHRLETLRVDARAATEAQRAAVRLGLGQLQERVDRLTTAYVDGLIEKPLFEERRASLLMERADLEAAMRQAETDSAADHRRLLRDLELAGDAYLSYKVAQDDEKRDFLRAVTSNRTVSGKYVEVTLAFPFSEIAKRFQIADGAPQRDIPRTWDRLLKKLFRLVEAAPPTYRSREEMPPIRDDSEAGGSDDPLPLAA